MSLLPMLLMLLRFGARLASVSWLVEKAVLWMIRSAGWSLMVPSNVTLFCPGSVGLVSMDVYRGFLENLAVAYACRTDGC